jgi:hypothetical protein
MLALLYCRRLVDDPVCPVGDALPAGPGLPNSNRNAACSQHKVLRENAAVVGRAYLAPRHHHSWSQDGLSPAPTEGEARDETPSWVLVRRGRGYISCGCP